MSDTIASLASMFFGAKLKGAVEHAGYEYKGAIGVSGLCNVIDSSKPVAVLFDLSKDDIIMSEAVTAIKEHTDSPIIAFCGHVETAKLQEAESLGCYLATNGAIANSFDAVISKVLDTHE